MSRRLALPQSGSVFFECFSALVCACTETHIAPPQKQSERRPAPGLQHTVSLLIVRCERRRKNPPQTGRRGGGETTQRPVADPTLPPSLSRLTTSTKTQRATLSPSLTSHKPHISLLSAAVTTTTAVGTAAGGASSGHTQHRMLGKNEFRPVFTSVH